MTILISTRKCFADYYKYILHKKARDLQLLAMPRLAVFRRSSGGLPAYKFDMQQLAWWPGYNRFSELWSTLSLSLLSTTQAVIYLHTMQLFADIWTVESSPGSEKWNVVSTKRDYFMSKAKEMLECARWTNLVFQWSAIRCHKLSRVLLLCFYCFILFSFH